MSITKCDVCKKAIKEYREITTIRSWKFSCDLCPGCAEKYLKSLVVKFSSAPKTRKEKTKEKKKGIV